MKGSNSGVCMIIMKNKINLNSHDGYNDDDDDDSDNDDNFLLFAFSAFFSRSISFRFSIALFCIRVMKSSTALM